MLSQFSYIFGVRVSIILKFQRRYCYFPKPVIASYFVPQIGLVPFSNSDVNDTSENSRPNAAVSFILSLRESSIVNHPWKKETPDRCLPYVIPVRLASDSRPQKIIYYFQAGMGRHKRPEKENTYKASHPISQALH